MSEAISFDAIKQYQENFDQLPQSRVVARAVSQKGIKATSEQFSSRTKLDPVYSLELKTGSVSNQLKSGRCWLFSTLNTLRHEFATKYNVANFQLSQNYLSFWDRVEKANLFFENILKTADKPLDDREVAFYLSTPDDDGGQWDNAAALIEKYGVVPQYVMPETQASEHTIEFSSMLNRKLRIDAGKLRQAVSDQKSQTEIDQLKADMLSEVYRMCAYTFGTPVENFDFEYRDDGNNYHLDRNLTPKTFYDKYFGVNLEDYIVVSSMPQENKPYGHLYTLESENTVIGGHPMKILNLEPEKLKQLAIRQLQGGETLWFGNDVLADSDRQRGLLDYNLYDKSTLFDMDLTMNVKDRLDYQEAEMSHAMTLVGVDLVDGKPTKWKVENSWGDKVGDKGYFAMSDSWWDNYVYEVVVKKAYLNEEDQQVLKEAPTNLAPWDALH